MKVKMTLFLCFFTIHFIVGQAWQISPVANAPEPITNNAVVEGVVNGTTTYIYTFGGLDSTKLYSGIHLRSYRYNTLTNVWDTIAPLPDTLGKIAAAASRVKDKIYIIGGYHVYANGSEASSDKVHIYDVNTNAYLLDGANIPIPIDDQVQAVWRDSLIYVITGWTNSGNSPAVQIYNPSSNSWQSGTSVGNNNIFKSFGASGTIIGDTIYYFGGASMAGSFNVQTYFRRGIIDPNNPTQINWSSFTWMNAKGYRMAATTVLGDVFWLGGAAITYNYNGIAYNGSGGVAPTGRSLLYRKSNHSFEVEYGYDLPMDLRGIGNVSDTVKYLVGGMKAGQQVSTETLRLVLNPDSVLTNNTKLAMPLPISFKAVPNPAHQSLTIKIEQLPQQLEYQLMTTAGVCLRKGRIYKEETKLDLTGLVAGVYYVQLVGEHKLGGQLVVIE
ncbi:T9SS C-terminal target domain-containing protein [Aureispira anguillae]|uniref:Secretion system C-terminal sorting domain-containing protein n=1 Tax=Aureispira anguillae TaxID=2864201 RepID=A0A915YI17_9BACT|nr:T9SS C-terminal target domain-containing protein [Aureispira anguillae]BDS13387.1 hypothetical protein AsAng_0041240 [Aureispira anguillae]